MTEEGFNHLDPEIVALMDRKAEAQTRALIEADERLQQYPNMDVARMRAVAREHDPTSILGDDDLPRRLWHPEWAVPPPGYGHSVTVTVRTEPATDELLLEFCRDLAASFAAPFEAMVKAINEILTTSSQSIGVFVQTVHEAAKAVQAPKTRHGHAAVCPRHGPTKGGLCRKCQR